jgi:2-oxoisovalerate dehydrogenase E1 component
MFNTAMHSLDPVVVLEHHSLYEKKFPIPAGDLDYCIPLGRARKVIEGTDITILAYSSMVRRVEVLEEELASRGVSLELIDLRSVDLPAVDYKMIGESVRKTGAVAIVEEAAASQSIGDRIASQITERFFDNLDTPPGCLTSMDVPNPVSKKLEATAMISDETIKDFLEKMAKQCWK